MPDLRRLVFVLLGVLMIISFGASAASQNPAASDGLLHLQARHRVLHANGSGQFDVVTDEVTLDPHQTALVICDMWDKHWCKSATERVGELAPHINALADALRARGALIIHCPSDTMDYYKNFPGRRLAQAAPKAPTAVPLQGWCGIKSDREPPLPIDDSDGGCPDDPPCKQGRAWSHEIDTIQIKPGDAITDSVEAYYLMRQHGITNVLLVGVHENMCVLGRPFSIRQLVAQGMNVLLVRDLTDTMYNPKMPPKVDHFSGTDLVTEHIEKYWCRTITSNQILGGKPFRFAADTRRIGSDGSPITVPSKTVVEPGYKHVSEKGLEAWRDMKFGLRIHWGLYSIPPVGPESWPLTRHDMAWDGKYYDNYKDWNPKDFNADDWMALMNRGGMKFFVFTTKHHEGFSMFDTKTRVKKRFIYDGPDAGKIEDCDLAYSIMETPYHRDIVKEICDAARRAGISPGLYFSHIDWYDADFRIDRWHPLLRFIKNLSYRPEDDPQAWSRMVERHREQVREILGHYGPLCEASLDMSMPDTFWPDMVQTVMMARSLQPDCLFRDRGIGPYGDYNTPERWIPDSPKNKDSPLPWEVIYPISDYFSYDPVASHYKGGDWIVSNLIDVVAKGGNFMVGFGPDRDGHFHPKAIEATEYAGRWLKVNGEAIYATRPWTYWKEGKDLRFTRSKDGRYVYAITLAWPGKELAIKSIQAKNGSEVRMLGVDAPLNWRNDAERGLVISLPESLQDGQNRPCVQAWSFRIEGSPREGS